jgi:hypothetical protein
VKKGLTEAEDGQSFPLIPRSDYLPHHIVAASSLCVNRRPSGVCLAPTEAGVGRSSAPYAHLRKGLNGLESERHGLAVHRIRFVDKVGQQTRNSACVLQPFGGIV